MSEMVKLGALWVKEGNKGKFLTGKFGDAQLLVFPNEHKKQDNHPDYIVYVGSRGFGKNKQSDNGWNAAADDDNKEILI